MKKAHYLCEECLRQGIYRPAEIVHHKIELDPVNIENPEITLSFNNLEAVCRECHAKVHDLRSKGLRYLIGDDGKVMAKC